MAIHNLDYLISPSDVGASPGGAPFALRVLDSTQGRLDTPAPLPFLPITDGFRFGDNGTGIIIPPDIDGVADAARAQQIGSAVYRALTFDDRAQDILNASIASARAKGEGVRLRFQIEPRTLRRLPLELLYRDADGYFATARDLSVVRYLALPGQPIRTLITPPPLHLLIAAFAPSDLPALEIETEIGRIREGLRPLIDQGVVALHELHNPSLDLLRRTLRETRTAVYHHIGHADFRGDVPLLALTRPDGRADLVDAAAFALNAAADEALRLVVLNGCDTAIVATNAALIGIAPQMMQAANLPAVVAMSSTLTDRSAVVFAEAFYRELGRGQDIDTALREGRIAIFRRTGGYSSGLAREFAVPVLFLRPAEARLIDFPERQNERILDDLGAPQAAAPALTPLTALYTRMANWKTVHDLLQSLENAFALVENEVTRVRAARSTDYGFALRGWGVCAQLIERLKAFAADPATIIRTVPFSLQADGSVSGDAWVTEIVIYGRGFARALEARDERGIDRESRLLRRALITHLNVSDKALADTNKAIQAVDLARSTRQRADTAALSQAAREELTELHQRLDVRVVLHDLVNDAVNAFRPLRDETMQPFALWELGDIESAWLFLRSNTLDSRLFPYAEQIGDLVLRDGERHGADYAVELFTLAERVEQAIRSAVDGEMPLPGTPRPQGAPRPRIRRSSPVGGGDAIRGAVSAFDQALTKHAFLIDQRLSDLTRQLQMLAVRLVPRGA
ncbi:MAG: CHAT domain-containing protein [bacterium]|nr:CHAT domain-containing protein [bacterium]